MVASINSIQAFWQQALPEYGGPPYRPAQAHFFTGGTRTGCGNASSAVGPFYCPVDQGVYLDTTFFRQMLEGELGAQGGAFAEAYVLAHEYGHHIQNLLGTMGQVRSQQGPESDAVRLELQADCYAGMWSKFAEEVENADGEVLILDLTDEDIANAIDAAQAVGDDRIQQRTSGRVNPDQWTHGSAAAREYWFSLGRSEGSLEACDTFAASNLHLDG
jgi:predicted metalloprotease